MPHMREVKTCDRCRHFKRRCDLVKPSCSRCVQAGVRCSFNVAAASVQQQKPQAPPPMPLPVDVDTSSSVHLPPLASTGLPPPPMMMQAPPLQHHPGPMHASGPPLHQPMSRPPDLSTLPVHHHQQPQHGMHPQQQASSPPFPTPTSVGAPFASAMAGAVSTTCPVTPNQNDSDRGNTPARNASTHGLISPTTSDESPDSGPTPMAGILTNGTSGSHHAPLTEGSPASAAASTNGHSHAQQDPTLPPGSQQRIVRKRKRNCLSCLRCHRLKVKCDKELPCGRCQASGNGRECYYSYNKGPNGGKFPCPTAPVPSSRDEQKPQMATWQVQHRVRGSSHWRELMAKIGMLAAGSTGGASPLAAALEGVGTNACLANFCLPGNFPFGTPGATKYYTRETVTRLLASERSRAEDYLKRYLELLDIVNPILDVDVFRDEIERYWQDPTGVSLCWLSQFLMVMGLGCFTSADEPPVATELMMAAEACLMQTPFMFRPTLMTLRALSLMSVAKLVCNATCWSVDSCWSLLGLLVRVAFIFGLPQERNDKDEELRDPVEREARRKLWLTILYLDIKVSMCTGMPPLTRPDELGGMPGPPEWGTPDSLQMVLFRSLPTVLNVLAQINSKKDHISYADVLQYNKQLRELMNNAQRVCTASLQRITVDIFLRRCLMVLHRPFALHPEGPVLFPDSYWSSLECSLALLVHYRDLWCNEEGLRLDLVGRAFVLDFFSATLTTCVHMLREDAPLSGAAATGCLIPPRQLILDTLSSCVDIWSGEQEKSVCWRTGYHLLRAVLALLPGTQAYEKHQQEKQRLHELQLQSQEQAQRSEMLMALP
ncbi:hypothetical protein HIM_06614 [Hirsutella minnesotensis 3608]|uniref:Zn(2)-C6 fungal-type domain-containing protein n=1 Tax=Hirsutella minnesotensis 3608 TaxID=1043627 RepID=A0A0F7ZIR9_9HYPO|nr:hypothetical protein HIM_06614 [Hirsutella minnesotensis 3608]